MSIRDIVGLAGDISATAMMVIALYGGYKRWWVWGWLYDKSEKEREELKAIAYKTTTVAERATTLVKSDAA